MTDRGAVLNELKTLRKNDGVRTQNIQHRIGPGIREIAGISALDTPELARQKLTGALEMIMRLLPEDLHLAVGFGLGIDPSAPEGGYLCRADALAAMLGKDVRTARRRVDDGLTIVAERLTTPSHDGDEATTSSWRIEHLQVAALPDRLEATEFRRIVAEEDGLDRLPLEFTLPRVEPTARRELEIEVLFGGTISDIRVANADRHVFQLQLPRTLSKGESYDYGLRFRSIRSMKPHFICMSRHRVDLFDLHVRFERDPIRRQVRRLDSGYQRDIDDPLVGEPLSTDDAGEVHLIFARLTPNRAYGARWQPSDGRVVDG
jgi:hypothetical protein